MQHHRGERNLIDFRGHSAKITAGLHLQTDKLFMKTCGPLGLHKLTQLPRKSINFKQNATRY